MFLNFHRIHSEKLIKLLKKLKSENYEIKMELNKTQEDVIRLTVFKDNDFYYSKKISCYFKDIFLFKIGKNVKNELLLLADKIEIKEKW